MALPGVGAVLLEGMNDLLFRYPGIAAPVLSNEYVRMPRNVAREIIHVNRDVGAFRATGANAAR